MTTDRSALGGRRGIGILGYFPSALAPAHYRNTRLLVLEEVSEYSAIWRPLPWERQAKIYIPDTVLTHCGRSSDQPRTTIGILGYLDWQIIGTLGQTGAQTIGILGYLGIRSVGTLGHLGRWRYRNTRLFGTRTSEHSAI